MTIPIFSSLFSTAFLLFYEIDWKVRSFTEIDSTIEKDEGSNRSGP